MSDFLIFGFFILGIVFQIFLTLGKRVQKGDLLELLKDIGGGLFVSFLFILIFFSDLLICLYIFCLGFSICFGLSFKGRLLLKTNEISLVAVTALIFSYTLINIPEFWWTGVVLPFCSLFFIFSLFVLLKKNLDFLWRGVSYSIYISVFMFLNILNISELLYLHHENLSPFIIFILGGMFLYSFAYLGILSKLIKLDYLNKEMQKELLSYLSYLGTFFYKTNINKILILFFTLSFMFIFIFNHKFNFASDNIFILFILFIITNINIFFSEKCYKNLK